MAKTHVRCQLCGMKPIDHGLVICPNPEYRRISDGIVHPTEQYIDIHTIHPSHWKTQYS
jgi:hypothetical protein